MLEKNKEKIPIHLLHRIELLIWLIIALIVVGLFSTGKIFKEFYNENDYQVFLPDVDGLVVGSPVRMMGVEVGHVTKVKPLKDEVYVKFILTNPNVQIKQGTEVTVEFSGMAGSKSLELYLPDKNTYIDNTTPELVVLQPKRLHDAMGLLDVMYKKLSSIIYSVASFGTRVEDMRKNNHVQHSGKHNVNKSLRKFDNYIEQSTNKADKLQKNLERIKNGK